MLERIFHENSVWGEKKFDLVKPHLSIYIYICCTVSDVA